MKNVKLQNTTKVTIRIIPSIISFALFIWITFFVFGKDYRGSTWAVLSFASLCLFLLTVLNIFVKRSMIQNLVFPYLLLICVFGNIFSYGLDKTPPIRQLAANDFPTFLQSVSVDALYPHLNQNTLIVAPGMLEEIKVSEDLLMSRLRLKEIIITPYQADLTDDQAEEMLTLSYLEWNTYREWYYTEKAAYYLIRSTQTDMDYYLARHIDNWFVIPAEYFREQATGDQDD